MKIKRIIAKRNFFMLPIMMLICSLMLNASVKELLVNFVGSVQLTSMLENVIKSDGYKYNLSDDKMVPMHTVKIIDNPNGNGYLAVYHHWVHSSNEVRLATSYNLEDWHYVVTIDTYASQPTIASLSDGGFIIGFEKEELVHGVRDGNSNLAFKYYRNLNALLHNKPSRSVIIKRTLSSLCEGTPNIYSVRLNPDIDHSVITIGFHYLDGTDKQGQGQLVNFSSQKWQSSIDTQLNSIFQNLGFINGNIGDRDEFYYLGKPYIIIEAQNSWGDFSTFHPYLYDREKNELGILNLDIPNTENVGFGNPTFSNIVLPNGGVGFVSTEFVFSGRNSGELIYWKQYPDSLS